MMLDYWENKARYLQAKVDDLNKENELLREVARAGEGCIKHFLVRSALDAPMFGTKEGLGRANGSLWTEFNKLDKSLAKWKEGKE
jgi:hypothetical protein